METLEEKLCYSFKDKVLLNTALTHKTFAFEANKPIEFYERLEFLGDSILGFIVAEQLYNSNKYFSEGELTRRRAIYVNNKFLANRAKELKLGKFLFLGKGEKIQKGSINPKNLANALEALIGAIFLDSNMKTTREIVLKHIFEKDLKF